MFIYIVISIPLLPFPFIPFPPFYFPPFTFPFSFSLFPALFPLFLFPFYFPLFSFPIVFSSFSPLLFLSIFFFLSSFLSLFPPSPPFPISFFPFPFPLFTIYTFIPWLFPLSSCSLSSYFLPIPFLVNIILKNLVKNFNLAYFCFTISGYNYHVN